MLREGGAFHAWPCGSGIEYHLTAKGRSPGTVLKALRDWGRKNT